VPVCSNNYHARTKVGTKLQQDLRIYSAG